MRYAIYFTPPEGDGLTSAAARWLGRNAFSGENFSPIQAGSFSPAELEKFTADPRRYGVHATLKAPFALAEDKTEGDILSAFDSFAATQGPFEIETLTLGSLGSFFALVPAVQDNTLRAFADSVVTAFEPFRTPLSESDYQRRKPETLTEGQRANLRKFGYPYVFEEYQFHMTLTGAVSRDKSEDMRHILTDVFAGFIGRPRPISHIALFVEPEAGAPFTVLKIAELQGDAVMKRENRSFPMPKR